MLANRFPDSLSIGRAFCVFRVPFLIVCVLTYAFAKFLLGERIVDFNTQMQLWSMETIIQESMASNALYDIDI